MLNDVFRLVGIAWNRFAAYGGSILLGFAMHAGARGLLNFLALKLSKGKVNMLEGNELEGKIGDVGSYKVDVKGDGLNIGKVEAGAEMKFEKDLIASMPGVLQVEFEGKVKMKADPVALALLEIKNLHSGFADVIANALAKLRAGEPLPDHVQAAVDAHLAA